VLVEQIRRDGEFSLVRPDGASRRVRWQHWKIQEPEYVHGWTVLEQCRSNCRGQVEWPAFFWLLFFCCWL